MKSVLSRFGICLMASVFLLAACQRTREHSAELFVFGTIVELKLYGVSGDRADSAFAELQQMFQHMHRDWHAWEPGRLTQINQAFSQGLEAEADPAIVEMIRRSQSIEQATGGRFNPAIGKLIGLWGFHTSEYPIIGPPPEQDAIDESLSGRPSSLDIRIDGLSLSSRNPDVQLDFGGVAKGYAVDLAVAYLRERGIGNAIANAGGDLRAIGEHGDRPWRVAVRDPGGGIIGSVQTSGDEALFTSGNYERFRQDEMERYPHILDPRSGWPVAELSSVTVIAGEGLLADAAATALVVAGRDEWRSVARSLGLDQVLVVDESGTVQLTAEMERRMQFHGDVERIVVD
jgi:thiamine biosynthesis lipoprotein